MTKSKQINNLLAIIRDEKNSVEKRSVALKKLEKEINKYALAEEGSFEANLSTFEQQWKPFEEMIAIENAYSEIDEDEIDELIQHEKERAQLKKMDHSTYSPKKRASEIEDLEKRWFNLHEFNKKRHKDLNISSRTEVPHEEDEFAELEEQIDEEGSEFSCAVSNVNQMIEHTEKSLEELENELHQLKTQNEEKPQLKQPKSLATPVADKNDIFDAFVKHVKSFIHEVGNCIKKIGKNNISLAEAHTKLNDTRKQLQNSQIRLKGAIINLKDARGEIAQQSKALISQMAKLKTDGETIQRKKILLHKVQSDNYKVPLDSKLTKGELIKKLTEQITTLTQEHTKSRNSLTNMSHQLNKTTEKANSAYENLKNAITMHKIATTNVDKAIKNVEQAQKQEKNIEQQQRIKNALTLGREESAQAKNLMASTEKVLEISQRRP